jgi:hypothetical protein
MKLRLRLAAIASVIALAAGAAVVLAGPASANDSVVWSNVAGYGKLWWNPNAGSDGAFYSSHSNDTPISQTECSGAWCELQLPNGKCMTYNYDGGGIVDAVACRELSSQYWATVEVTSTRFQFENDYASGFFGCADFISSAGSGQEVSLICATGTYDEWSS